MSRLSRAVRRREQHDVVFYTPFVGWTLSASATTPPGGAETQILRLAKALSRQERRVAIVAYGDSDDLPASVDGVTIVARGRYAGNKRLWGKVGEALRIWHALWRTPSPVVVYRAAGLELGLIGVFTRATRRRLVYSSANIIDFDFRRLCSKRRDLLLYELGIRIADEIVVQTEEQVRMCAKRYRREPILIKSLAEVGALNGNVPQAFLWVGRLVSYKRPDLYLELARSLPGARFRMIGVPAAYPESDRLLGETILQEAREIPNLELLPPRSQPEVEELMSHAVASVNTADYEGMPNVLLEGWCRGIPALVLTHDPGAVVERYGIGGFARGSFDRFVELAAELWRDRGQRGELSARCQDYIVLNHSPDRIARQWLHVLLGYAEDRATDSASEVELTCAG